MENIGILVLENGSLAAPNVETMVSELGYKNLGTFKENRDVLNAVKKTKPDLIILDTLVERAQDGIKMAEQIADENIPLIFVASSLNNRHYDLAKKTGPVAYLVKPFESLALQSAVELALLKNNKPQISTSHSSGDLVSEPGAVFVKMNKIRYKVYFVDILWIEVDGNYCYLNTKEKKYVLKTSLKKILDKVNPYADFVRIHKQFAIPTKDLISINASENTLSLKHKTFPIGRTYKKSLLDKLQQL